MASEGTNPQKKEMLASLSKDEEDMVPLVVVSVVVVVEVLTMEKLWKVNVCGGHMNVAVAPDAGWNEIKRDGAGRGNWGAPTDEVAPETEEPATENEKNVAAEKLDPEKQLGEEDAGDVKKENTVNEPEEKEPENKEMTLDEYEKVLEEKRKALLALKTEERKVSMDKDLVSMQLLSSKKSEEEIFVKLGSDKDKRKDAAEKEEKAKKSVSINEFLKPAESERHNGSAGRGRGGRGRGPRGGFSGGSGNMSYNIAAPAIDDVGQFPSLAAK
ncbi:hypothetical protein RHSIM_Rhsim07G0117800 [Rhododendron simsii]|uniref:Hyaluronan/mRNA-binding protein domain-containing protein n=1 Tax=Rhododendron simsii TaxID=118357 RepID=A0A834GNR8_RHOSS|nr:hypothetical protein RHSIM_Rhsim07G0117800 [Rhododendron simsii]